MGWHSAWGGTAHGVAQRMGWHSAWGGTAHGMLRSTDLIKPREELLEHRLVVRIQVQKVTSISECIDLGNFVCLEPLTHLMHTHWMEQHVEVHHLAPSARGAFLIPPALCICSIRIVGHEEQIWRRLVQAMLRRRFEKYAV
jgi:hypothetical protein